MALLVLAAGASLVAALSDGDRMGDRSGGACEAALAATGCVPPYTVATCDVCVDHHQHTLRAAGCTADAVQNWCTASHASSLEGKVLFGYQGWFDAAGSNSPHGGGKGAWIHWSGQAPNATDCTFDLWPAMSEYPVRFPTPGLRSRADGSPMSLFSDFTASTQDVHFRWMREYGLDGVFVQRFVNELEHGSDGFKDAVLLQALRAAERNGRAVSIMYDISGADESLWAETILRDWRHLITDLNVTQSPSWIHHDGKPVLAIWGIGFTQHPGTPESSLQLLQQLRAVLPITFVGGVPTHWRSGDGDSKPNYDSVYSAMDVLSPWLVGRYSDDAGFDSNMQNIFVPDARRLEQQKLGYAPVVFPGFSWSNMMRTRNQPPSPFNDIPRRAGKFWSHQAEGFAGMDQQPLFIYAAMFDEVDEGTAMFKAASTVEETPAAPAQFLYLSVDGTSVPSDFYLSLAGNFTSKWRRERIVPPADVRAKSLEWGAAEWNRSFDVARLLTERKIAVLVAANNSAATADTPPLADGPVGLVGQQAVPTITHYYNCSTCHGNWSVDAPLLVPSLGCPTLQSAIDCAPDGHQLFEGRLPIQLRPGIYREKVVVGSTKGPLLVQGLSSAVDGVVIAWDDADAPAGVGPPGCRGTPRTPHNSGGEWNSQTLRVDSNDFVLANVTVLNDACGMAGGGRNFALMINGDRVEVTNCRIYGQHDTFYTGLNRVYVRDSYINGSVDFIFGAGSAVFDRCELVAAGGHVTAHKGTATDENGQTDRCDYSSCSTYLIRNSRLPAVGAKAVADLGRAWRSRATVVYDSCWMDSHINPGGWGTSMNGCNAAAVSCPNITFAEHNSSGPGANPHQRVRWSKQLSASDISQRFTEAKVLRGWIPSTSAAF